jgi:hypothetical protein
LALLLQAAKKAPEIKTMLHVIAYQAPRQRTRTVVPNAVKTKKNNKTNSVALSPQAKYTD